MSSEYSCDSGSCEQIVTELATLKLAGISVFAVALSSRADEANVRGISSVPQLANINYFISPTISGLSSLAAPLATQVSLRKQINYSCLFVCVSLYSPCCLSGE